MTLIDRFLTAFRSEDQGNAEKPGLVQNEDGTVDLIAPDGTRTPLGSGGSVTSREVVVGSSVSIADGDNGYLTWDTRSSGDVLLDATDPAQPTVVTSGVYVVAVTAGARGDMTAGGAFSLALDLDANNDDPEIVCHPIVATAADLRPATSLTMAYYIPAGGVVNCFLQNHDGGGQPIIFGLIAIIQRVS